MNSGQGRLRFFFNSDRAQAGMQFRHSGQSADRRRRILFEDSTVSIDEFRNKMEEEPDRAPRRSYSTAAETDQQLRVTDLLPRRAWKLALISFGLALLVVVLAALDHQVHEQAAHAAGRHLSVLTLEAASGLATWFGSTVLLLASVGSLLVYGLRRHRVDDYRGRYRCWLWSAAASLLASIDVTARWHVLLGDAMNRSTGISLGGLESGWWLGVLGTGGALLAIRLGIELRRCRIAITCLLATVAAYTIAVIARVLPGWESLPRQTADLAALAGHVGLLLTIAWYGRSVCIEAQGRAVKQKKVKRQRRRKQNEQPSADSCANVPRSQQNKKRVPDLTDQDSTDSDVSPNEADGANPESSSRRRKRQRSQARQAASLKVVGEAELGRKQAESNQKQNVKPDETHAVEKPAADPPLSRKKRRQQQRQAERSAQETSKPTVQRPHESQADTAEQDDGESLSKAERRKQRKQRRNQSRRAA